MRPASTQEMYKDFAAADHLSPVAVPSVQRSPNRMVFAHYFPPYPLSKDDAPAAQDYYTKQYLTVDGESGKHVAYGGFLRDRPLPATPQSGDWHVTNQETEVREAISVGINGFSVDLLSFSSPNWTAALNLLQAAQNVSPHFAVMAMPDMTGLRNLTPEQFAAGIATFASYPSAYRLSDGRLVLSPFDAEIHTPQWWTQEFSILSSEYGIHIAFVPLLLDFMKNEAAFAPISYGLSNWGPRSPSSDGTAYEYSKIAHDAGKLWMQPVSVQDERPYAGVYNEADNTANLRATWNAAINEKAEWVQLVTWNDYSESTQIAPSENAGWSFLNICSYYIRQFRTGLVPHVQRDLGVLTYRTQPVRAQTAVSESEPMHLVPGSSPARNDVEMLTILTKRAWVHVTVGGVRHKYQAPAGVSTHLFRLRDGKVHASVHRHGQSVLRTFGRGFTVGDPTYRQDLSYHAVTLAPTR